MEEGFYDSRLVSSTYNVLTNEANQIGGDLEFYKQTALRFGSPILELGVGTGRVAWMLANAGHKVVGLDISVSMLREARKQGINFPDEAKNNVQLIQGDMTDFSVEGTFPLVIVPFSTFNHLTTASAQRSCLTAIKRHLSPGGRVVIDVFDPILDACAENTTSPNLDRVFTDSSSGEQIRRRSVHRVNDPFSQTFKETFRVERLNKIGEVVDFEEPVHHLRWATRQEMIYLFELTCFEVEESYGDFNCSKPSYGSRQIWVVR